MQPTKPLQTIKAEEIHINETVDRINDRDLKETHAEEHISSGEYLKSAVYGGIDGTINVLAVILGGIGSNTSAWHILSISISVILGDGIGMALGDYLSMKAETGFIAAQHARELDEVENKLEAEKQEVIEIYQKKGYTPDQSIRVADLYATNSQAFVNIMMLEELGLVVSDTSPIRCGITTFFAFVICGTIPIIPYIISVSQGSLEQQLIASIVIGGVQLFSLGFGKAMMLGINIFKSGMEILLLGAATVAIGYGIGLAFQT